MVCVEMEEEHKDINTTAGSIAGETGSPALIECLRLPRRQSDEKLAVSIHAMANRDVEPNDEFEAPGHPADTTTELEDMADEFLGLGKIMRQSSSRSTYF
jgi:hypothetical protein